MKTTLLSVICLIAVIFIFFPLVSYASKSKSATGLVLGKLAECSSKPNCVVSEYNEKDNHFIAPFPIKNSVSIASVKMVLLSMGANIVEEQSAYIAATFTSRLFRFVDDVEVRIDQAQGLVHIRSASRTGYSDMGVNRKRMVRFKDALAKTQ